MPEDGEVGGAGLFRSVRFSDQWQTIFCMHHIIFLTELAEGAHGREGTSPVNDVFLKSFMAGGT